MPRPLIQQLIAELEELEAQTRELEQQVATLEAQQQDLLAELGLAKKFPGCYGKDCEDCGKVDC